MIRKLLIVPWFGPPPVWMPHWWTNIRRLEQHGYTIWFDQDADDFRRRVRRTLGIDAPIVEGGSKIHDYRAAFGVLFAEEIAMYEAEWYGHTDLDCVYGRVEQWVTDDFLSGLDLHSNHDSYVCGPWSLYRTGATEEIFRSVDGWREILEEPTTTGWVEYSFSRACERELGDRLAYTYFQTRELNHFRDCRWDGDRLMEKDTEVAMLHFRRLSPKVYPEQLIR